LNFEREVFMKKVLGEMTRKVMYALEGDRLDDVWALMNAAGVRHIPVTRGHKVVGILSDRDVLRLGKRSRRGSLRVPHCLVGDVMTKDVVTCSTTDTIGNVAAVFLEKKIDALPVTLENGELLGIITSTDLLRLLRDAQGELGHSLPFEWEPTHLAHDGWRPGAANVVRAA
jgi:CBS domain-containing protein